METIEPRWRSQFDPALSPREEDRRAIMIAVLGAAVLGLVPLPPMATSDRWPGPSGHWRSRGKATTNSPRPICTLQAVVEKMATPQELARLCHEPAGIDADMAGNRVRSDAT
jgi:hypothetical protein